MIWEGIPHNSTLDPLGLEWGPELQVEQGGWCLWYFWCHVGT